ncbi:MAG TPA: outer membrane protein assembly factor BamE [Steroidobacteraceae bacterium]|jgi:outer membrane protein assembly factor BamE|nr:outer membrane protein assembly factor BamE [Steroidobacteraceae bacterium]
MHRLMMVCTTLGLALLASGCVYRMNIQQGNYLEPRAVSQLQVGMTRSQVRYLLGTPMVPDAFDNDRWDYLYYLKKGRLKAPEQRHLIVYFENDKVSKVDKSGVGPMPPVEQREIEPDSQNAKANAAS